MGKSHGLLKLHRQEWMQWTGYVLSEAITSVPRWSFGHPCRGSIKLSQICQG